MPFQVLDAPRVQRQKPWVDLEPDRKAFAQGKTMPHTGAGTHFANPPRTRSIEIRPTTFAIGFVVHSSLWMASAAVLLQAVGSKALGIPVAARPLWIVFAGVLAIYNLDHLRDLHRDRATAPQRTAFVENHRSQLWVLCGTSALCSGALLCGAPTAAWLVAVGVGILGLAHRRLKGLRYSKEGYLALAWLAGAVWLPAAFAQSTDHVLWTSACLLPALFANDLAASIHDGDGLAKRWGSAGTLHLARLIALVGVLLLAIVPASVRPVCIVSGTTLLALLRFRESERYRSLAMDGALIAGALIALTFD